MKLSQLSLNCKQLRKNAPECIWQVKTVQLDVTDSEKVTALAREVDLVFNAVGPFVKFGVPILKAVIEAGRQAISIYLIGTMKDKMSGVFAPEGILQTEDFFNELVRITNKANGWDFTLDELLPTEKEVLGKHITQ